MKITKVYTDGACSGNPGSGGWGVVILTDKLKTYNGSEKETTNNRMELKAAIMGIKNSDVTSQITIYTDSKYVKDGITNWITNWKKNNWITASKKPVKNQDLWKELDNMNNQFNVKWEWVKAHQDNDSDDSKYNNMADELARKGAMEWTD
jgi:ribonuclease HI|tara:strand:- start:1417 stop:1866 length:450 start_codon:yes stop_codon:yes gene_type:complete